MRGWVAWWSHTPEHENNNNNNKLFCFILELISIRTEPQPNLDKWILSNIQNFVLLLTFVLKSIRSMDSTMPTNSDLNLKHYRTLICYLGSMDWPHVVTHVEYYTEEISTKSTFVHLYLSLNGFWTSSQLSQLKNN